MPRGNSWKSNNFIILETLKKTFENIADYNQSSKQYVNIMSLLEIIRYIPDNNNIKDI